MEKTVSQQVVENSQELIEYLQVTNWKASKINSDNMRVDELIEGVKFTYVPDPRHHINAYYNTEVEGNWDFFIYGPDILPSKSFYINDIKSYMEKITYKE